jgi:hypothetical protein
VVREGSVLVPWQGVLLNFTDPHLSCICIEQGRLELVVVVVVALAVV